MSFAFLRSSGLTLALLVNSSVVLAEAADRAPNATAFEVGASSPNEAFGPLVGASLLGLAIAAATLIFTLLTYGYALDLNCRRRLDAAQSQLAQKDKTQ